MWLYIYDGSFAGLLTSIYEAYHSKEMVCEIVSQEDFVSSFFSKQKTIKSDSGKAQKVDFAVRTKIGTDAWRYIYLNYLSSYPERGMWIFRYLQFGFKNGKNTNLYLSQPEVLQIHQTARRVQLERHRLLGLLRFKQTDFHLDTSLNLSGEEAEFQILWKEYFNNITITERKNPRLQKQYMPVRYWKHLIEKD
jgi:probable DNA metabolism protein